MYTECIYACMVDDSKLPTFNSWDPDFIVISWARMEKSCLMRLTTCIRAIRSKWLFVLEQVEKETKLEYIHCRPVGLLCCAVLCDAAWVPCTAFAIFSWLSHDQYSSHRLVYNWMKKNTYFPIGYRAKLSMLLFIQFVYNFKTVIKCAQSVQ